jgi:hypothetical protein
LLSEGSVDVSSVTDVHHNHDQAVVVDFVEDPEDADPDPIEFPRPFELFDPVRSGAFGQGLDLGIDPAEVGLG